MEEKDRFLALGTFEGEIDEVEAEAEAIFGRPDRHPYFTRQVQHQPQIKAPEDTKTKEAAYKTSPTMLKAIRKYEANIKQDKDQLERRNHQKNYSGAKSFITYAAKIHELHYMKELIEDVLKWSSKVEQFDTLKRPERKEKFSNRFNEETEDKK